MCACISSSSIVKKSFENYEKGRKSRGYQNDFTILACVISNMHSSTGSGYFLCTALT
jgi:hypothetical protein